METEPVYLTLLSRELRHKDSYMIVNIDQKTAVSVKLSPLTSLTRCTERCFLPSSPDHSARDSSAVMERAGPSEFDRLRYRHNHLCVGMPSDILQQLISLRRNGN